jgi:hypothetical protein
MVVAAAVDSAARDDPFVGSAAALGGPSERVEEPVVFCCLGRRVVAVAENLPERRATQKAKKNEAVPCPPNLNHGLRRNGRFKMQCVDLRK